MMDQFLAFSSEVTAFTTLELRGTGMAQAYFETVSNVVGAPILYELLTRYTAIEGKGLARKEALRREIFADQKLGSIARNIIKLWYIGIWEPLPRVWTEEYGPIANNNGFTVSANAYREGLLWHAIGAPPPGAKAPGYASWTFPPNVRRASESSQASDELSSN